ncbi:MAG: epoxyqueuosine reductase QueH [Spirochaetia bacterium]|nr:epoxyqueuosine reductase QueH [Spirochaetia bacterium]
MKQNYQKKLDKIIDSIKDCSSTKPSLLLHACCGPCSSYVIEYLAQYFDITILYYNPNIYPQEEYTRRLEELKNLLPVFPPAKNNNVILIEQEYNPEDFYSAIKIKEEPELANEPEKGERCRRCYNFRLKRAYEYAKNHGFDWFTTTLSISPFKDADKINIIGKELSAQNSEIIAPMEPADISKNNNVILTTLSNPKWLTSDFKKKGGFKRSLELSSEYNLYRQQYCGCVYSKTNTEKSREENSHSN